MADSNLYDSTLEKKYTACIVSYFYINYIIFIPDLICINIVHQLQNFKKYTKHT